MKASYVLFSLALAASLSSCKKDCDKDPVDTGSGGTSCTPTSFSKVFGGATSEMALAMTSTADGGYVTVGLKDQPGSTIVNDVYVVRVNKNGEKLWEKTFGGSGNDLGVSVTTGIDGGFVIGAYTNSTDGDVEGNHGGYDAWLLKLNDNGEVMWKRALGGHGAETTTKISKTSNGYLVAAASRSIDIGANFGGADIMLVKLDINGNIVTNGFYGGDGNDGPGKIMAMADGSCMIVGSTESSFSKGQTDVLVMKIDAALQLVWQKNFGGSLSDDGRAIATTADGGYTIAAETHSADGDLAGTAINGTDGDTWIFKVNHLGSVVWSKRLSGAQWDTPHDITASTNGAFLVSGFTNSSDGDFAGATRFDAFVVKLNAQGNKMWLKTLGGTIHDYAYDIVKTDACTFTIAGYSSSKDGDVPSNSGHDDIWLYKGADN